ncbi:siderophore-interacting protein [Georgenia sp. Z1344]|uniref:siderophore-interacting protein n=1 Tax=Georgenia sp. Z1344 TaxID=3416706 RepID=UPI003CF89B14
MNQRYPVLQRTALSAVGAVYSRTMSISPSRDFYPEFPATVTEVVDLTPSFRRVRIAAPELATVERLGPDEYIGVYMPPVGKPLRLPAPALMPRGPLGKIPEAERPELRWYTIRAQEPGSGTIDVDVVATGHDGPGSRWIERVAAGDEVGVRVQTAPYGSAPAAGHHVLLADETALPAMLAILDAHRDDPDRRFTAILEVPSMDLVTDEVDADEITIVVRGDDAPGTALLAALPGADLDGADYGWVCAEAAAAAGGRRHLVKERGMDRRSIMFTGYWKVGRARL